MPEELIIKQGQKPTHMYILSQGQCEVLVKDQFKKDVFVRDISPGMLFGEVALIFGTRRTASVKSLDQCTVGGLSDEIFFDMLKNFPEIENMLRIGTRQYSDHWKQYQIKALSQVDYLEEIPYSLLEEMHYRLTIENYEKGARIFNRG
jgi:CRP-like cAMP-binding protein